MECAIVHVGLLQKVELRLGVLELTVHAKKAEPRTTLSKCTFGPVSTKYGLRVKVSILLAMSLTAHRFLLARVVVF